MGLATENAHETRVPLVEEHLSVERKQVETDRVRVRTVVETEKVLVEELLRVGRLDVTRVVVDREVSDAPKPYRDGDVLVIPIVEERLVVEKRLFVVEELRMASSSQEEAISVPVSLRRTRAIVERDDPDQLATGRK